MIDIVQKAIELLEDWDTCYSYNEEIRDTAIAALKTQDDEITRLRKENEQLRDSYDTEALLISYNLGYACGKDITKDIVKDEIERRHAEFTKVDMELVADLAAERNRLRERLAEADEANRRVSDENEKLRFERDTIGEANYVNGWNDAINSSEAMQDLRAENNKLREALKPFAYYASQIPDDISDTCSASGTVGDLRAAAAALGETDG